MLLRWRRLRRSRFDAEASAQGVAGGATGAGTDRHMVGSEALCLGAACARTRIGALLVDARPVERTVGVAEAFGSTADVRIAVVFGQAFAVGVGVLDATVGVAAARRRLAGVGGRRWDDGNV